MVATEDSNGGEQYKVSNMNHKKIKTHCQQCFSACGMLVEVKDGKPIKIEGDPDDPNTKGALCGRGLTSLTRLYDPLRIKAPLVRTNPEKGIGIDPKWKEVSWEEAFTLVGERFRKIREENPNKLIYLAWPFEHYVRAQAWGSAFGTANKGFVFSGASNKCANPNHMIGIITHGAIVEAPDLTFCKYLIILGTQLGIGGGNQWSIKAAREIADARERGMKLVVVDPRLPVGAVNADEWLAIKPGTDLALLLSMIYLLLHEYKIYDSLFLKKSTNAPYLLDSSGNYVRDAETGKPMVWDDEVKAAKRFDENSIGDPALEGTYRFRGIECMPAFQFLADRVKEYTPAWAAEITTISEEKIRRITKELAEYAQIGTTIILEGHQYPLRPVSMISFKGVQAHTNGGISVIAQEIIMILLGALNVPGGVLSKTMDATRFGAEPELLGSDKDGLVAPTATGWAVSTPFKFPPERLDLGEYCPLSFDLGHLVPLVILNSKEYGFNYEPEALLIYHSNPLKNCGDLNIMTQALKKLDMVVNINTYLDETCDFVDVILPESSFLERYNLINFTFDNVGLQVMQPVVEKPLYKTMDGMDILTEIASKANCLYGEGGWNDALNKTIALREPFCLDLNRKYTWEEILDVQAKCHSNGEKDLTWYRKNGNDFRPSKLENKYLIYRNARLPFYLSVIQDVGEELKVNLENCKMLEKLGPHLRLQQYSPIPYWEPTPILEEEDPNYDLHLIIYQSFLTSYADMATNPFIIDIAKIDPYQLSVTINSETAKRRGIKDGDEVWVESRLSKGKTKAKLSQAINPEVVAVSGGFGRWVNHPIAKGEGIIYNDLTPLDLHHSGMIGGSMENSVKVKVYKSN